VIPVEGRRAATRSILPGDATITVTFDVPGMTAAHYDRIIARLEAAGAGAPPGRLAHIASPVAGGWRVVDVWESPAALERFAATLGPIVADVVGAPPEPAVTPTHNFVLA